MSTTSREPLPPLPGRLAGELGAWIAVALWAGFIFLAIPFARRLESLFGERLGGPRAFLILGVGFVLAGLALAAIRLYRTRAARARSQYAWLMAIAVAFALYATRLRTPVEALHFAEYTILSLLAFGALSHRFRDRGVYLCAVLVCALVGTVDELLQWLTPERYGDLFDVALNVAAAALAQLALWLGIRPSSIDPRCERRTLRLATLLAALQVVLLIGWISATPARLTLWGERLPRLAELARNPSVLAEYGHLYRDPEIGRFRSRFTLDELLRIDRDRGSEVAAILDAYRDPATYDRFLVDFPAGAAPFAHEARVRLFRRNRFLDRLRAASDDELRRELATVAWRENRILERLFPTTLAASVYPLPPRRRSELEALSDPTADYTSPVGVHLITAVSERWLRGALIASLLLLASIHHLLRGDPER
jgi:hypothetical protein